VDAGHRNDDDDDDDDDGGDTDDDARDDASERDGARAEAFRAGDARVGERTERGGRGRAAFPGFNCFCSSDDAGGRRGFPGRGGCRAVEWNGVDVDVGSEWVG
jgi:hypothetical protein